MLPTIAGYMAGAVLACGLMAAVGVGVGSLVRGQLAALIAVFVWAMGLALLLATVTARTTVRRDVT